MSRSSRASSAPMTWRRWWPVARQVQGTVGYFHHQGCCQLPPDLKRVTDTLCSLVQSQRGIGAYRQFRPRAVDGDSDKNRQTGKNHSYSGAGQSQPCHCGGNRRHPGTCDSDIGTSALARVHIQRRHVRQMRGVADATSGMVSNCVIYPWMISGEKGLWIKDTPGREPEMLTGTEPSV